MHSLGTIYAYFILITKGYIYCNQTISLVTIPIYAQEQSEYKMLFPRCV